MKRNASIFFSKSYDGVRDNNYVDGLLAYETALQSAQMQEHADQFMQGIAVLTDLMHAVCEYQVRLDELKAKELQSPLTQSERLELNALQKSIALLHQTAIESNIQKKITNRQHQLMRMIAS